MEFGSVGNETNTFFLRVTAATGVPSYSPLQFSSFVFTAIAPSSSSSLSGVFAVLQRVAYKHLNLATNTQWPRLQKLKCGPFTASKWSNRLCGTARAVTQVCWGYNMYHGSQKIVVVPHVKQRTIHTVKRSFRLSDKNSHRTSTNNKNRPLTDVTAQHTQA